MSQASRRAAPLIRVYADAQHDPILERVADMLRDDGVIIYPTDTLYGIGCAIDHPKAVARVIQLKGLKPKEARFSFICHSISQVASYARVSDWAFRLMKDNLPGPFTFILPGLNGLSEHFLSKRKTVGVRIPAHGTPCGLVQLLGVPLLTTSLPAPAGEPEYAQYPELMLERWGHLVDAILDCGTGELIGSTVVDCTEDGPTIIRQGKGQLKEG